MIYFDQAATSFPKPPEVAQAVAEAINNYGANPGRGSHKLARQAASVINKARNSIASLFGCTDPKKVLFFSNATAALNQAIKGFPFQKGEHVITSSIEHNSVRRPLEFMKKEKQIEITYLTPGSYTDEAWLDALQKAIKTNTKLLVVSHASNVTGNILPLEKMIQVAKKYDLTILVDASQTAGHLPINMREMGIDMLAFPGHKGLLGPQGTGALIVEGNIPLIPLHHGGTGSHSETIDQPEVWPERYESGTLNTPGIAGLHAAIQFIQKKGINEIVSRETLLINYLIKSLTDIKEIKVFGPKTGQERVAVAAFQLGDIPSHEIGMILDEHYHIAVRTGLHCSPITHEGLGTIDTGLIRVSMSFYNTQEEIDDLINALEEIKAGYMEM